MGASVEAVLADAADPWPVDDGAASCVVFSPPYNAGIDYDGAPAADQMEWEAYEAMAVSVMKNARRALGIPGGRCWVNVVPTVPAAQHVNGGNGGHSGQTSAARVSLIDIWTRAGDRAGLSFRDLIAWATPGRAADCAWGSFQSPSAPNTRGEWEAILAFSHGDWARPTPDRWKGWKDGEGEWPRLCSNVWSIRPETDRTHPAPFPLELPMRCIRLSTWPDERVLDPFVGAGTTMLAAQQLGRDCIGLDRSQQYVDMANERVAQLGLFGATNVEVVAQ